MHLVNRQDEFSFHVNSDLYSLLASSPESCCQIAGELSASIQNMMPVLDAGNITGISSRTQCVL